MPQPGVGVAGVACLPSAVGRLCLRLVQYLQCQRETETERDVKNGWVERSSDLHGRPGMQMIYGVYMQPSKCIYNWVWCVPHWRNCLPDTHTYTRNNSLCKYCRVWKCIICTSFLYRYIYKLVYRRYCWLWIAFQVFVKINKKCFRRLLTNCIICQSADKADTHTHTQAALSFSLNAMSTHDCTRIAHAKR